MAARAESTVLAGARVVLPTGVVENGRVRVEGGRITEAGPTASATGAASVEGDAGALDLTGHWVVPGFVDMHNHGGGGASFTSGDADAVLKGVRTHQEHGTTTLVASTVTGEMDFLAQRAGFLSELVEQGDLAASTSRARSSRRAARARTARSCCATRTRPRCASSSTRPVARRRW